MVIAHDATRICYPMQSSEIQCRENDISGTIFRCIHRSFVQEDREIPSFSKHYLVSFSICYSHSKSVKTKTLNNFMYSF